MSAAAAPIARGVTLPNGYVGTLASFSNIPLGYDSTHMIVVGLIDTNVMPKPVSPYRFIPYYWDEKYVRVKLP